IPLSMWPPTPTSTRFPYTTLFRSRLAERAAPAAFCCAFDFAGMSASFGEPEGETALPAIGSINSVRQGASGNNSPLSQICKPWRSEEHTSELQSRENLVCRLLLEK